MQENNNGEMEWPEDERIEVIDPVLQGELDKLDALRAYNGEDKVVTSHELLRQFAKKPARISYFTGMKRLDKMTNGVRKGELVVMSGPTGEGKTTFLQSLTRVYTTNNMPCAWFSFEVGAEDLLERFGDDLPVFSLPQKNTGSSVEWLRERIWEAIAKYGTEVVFIDHLHYVVDLLNLSVGNPSITIGLAMREIKKIAVEADVIIYLVAHLKKTEIDKAPTKADLRDSSLVAQEADKVWIIWRRRVEKADGSLAINNNLSSLAVEKDRRTGRVGTIRLAYVNGRFVELTDATDEEGED